MFTGVAAAVFWIGGVLRVGSAIKRRERRPLCLALICFGTGAFFDISSIATRFDRAVGVRDLADLVAHVLGLIGVYFLLRTLDGLAGAAGPRGSRRLLPFLVAAVVLSVTLFAVTPMPTETSAFTAQYAGRPSIAAYWAISVAFPSLCLAQLMRTAVANWRSPARELRVGLRIVAFGAVLGFIYAALKFAEVACQLAGFDLAASVRSVDLSMLGAGLVLIAAGLTITSPLVAGPLWGWSRRMSARYLSYRLGWLWRTICIRARAADVLPSSADPEFRLLRRVVEIRDGAAALWYLLTPADVARVRARLADAGDRSPPAHEVEGAALGLALQRTLNGLSGDRSVRTTPPPRAGILEGSRPLSPREEARELIAMSWLVRRAMRSNGC